MAALVPSESLLCFVFLLPYDAGNLSIFSLPHVDNPLGHVDEAFLSRRSCELRFGVKFTDFTSEESVVQLALCAFLRVFVVVARARKSSQRNRAQGKQLSGKGLVGGSVRRSSASLRARIVQFFAPYPACPSYRSPCSSRYM